MTTTDEPSPVPNLDGVPIFGVNPEPANTRRTREFGVEVETQVPATRGHRPHVERHIERFTAYFDLDGGAVLGLMNSRSEMEQANATAVLLGTSLDDLDGVPVEWRLPVEPEYDEAGNVLRADATDEHPDGAPLYLSWDGELSTLDELRQLDDLVDGSSRRRFSVIMASPRHRVRIEALNEIGRWLIAEVAGRPTVRSTPSRHGPAPARRGSARKR